MMYFRLMLAVLVVFCLATAGYGQCSSRYLAPFTPAAPFGNSTNNSFVKVMTEWSPYGDGQTFLVVGGNFTSIGSATFNRIATWNGTNWSSIGSGFDGGTILAIAVYRGDLYVGGNALVVGGTTGTVARWNGSSWQMILLGTSSIIKAMTVYQDELVVGGIIYTTGTAGANNIARWNGSAWNTLGTGVQGEVFALAVFNSQLVVGGHIWSVGSQMAHGLCAWNGASWTVFGPTNILQVGSFTVSNGLLYVGYKLHDGQVQIDVARWDGLSWERLGIADGCGPEPACMIVYENELVIGSAYSFNCSTNSGDGIISLHNGSWTPLGGGIFGNIASLYQYKGDLLIGGNFNTAGGYTYHGLARWRSSTVCRSDFNCSGMLGIDDIFVFLNAWFAGDARADFNEDGTTNVGDIFIFLNVWFSGC